MQNGYIESLSARLRDECLNEHWFVIFDLMAQCRITT